MLFYHWHLHVMLPHVVAKPKLTQVQPGPMSVKAGKSASCEVTVEGMPQPTITWSKDGHAVDSSKLQIADMYTTLKFTRASQADAGTYIVSAENSAGKDSLKILCEIIGEFACYLFLFGYP